jgi:hypothetical protein
MRWRSPCVPRGEVCSGSALLAALLLSAGSLAAAQDASAENGFETSGGEGELDPAWGEAQSDGPELHPRGRSFGGFDVGVPLMLDVDRDLIRPGADLHLQGGVDLGYVAFFLHGGFRFIPVDFDRAADKNHPEYEGQGRDPLKNPYFGFGVRAQLPNRSRVMPYVSGSFDFNFWHFRDEAVACGGYYYWYCAGYDVYEFTPGFTGRAGLAIYLGQGLYVDLGAGVSMSFEGNFFSENQTWVEPFGGLTYRR